MQAVEQHARAHRSQDLGKSLMPGGRVKGEEKDKVRLQCHSQIYVVPFYERLGFRKEGDEFDEEGGESESSVSESQCAFRLKSPDPHQKMIKDVELDQA